MAPFHALAAPARGRAKIVDLANHGPAGSPHLHAGEGARAMPASTASARPTAAPAWASRRGSGAASRSLIGKDPLGIDALLTGLGCAHRRLGPHAAARRQRHRDGALGPGRQDPGRAHHHPARRQVPRPRPDVRPRGAAQHDGPGLVPRVGRPREVATPAGFTAHKFGFAAHRPALRPRARPLQPRAHDHRADARSAAGSRIAARRSAGTTTSWSTATGSTTSAPRSSSPRPSSRSGRSGSKIPCPPITPRAGERLVGRARKVPICTGENLARRQGFKDFIINQGCDILHPDLRNTGGFLETKRIADLAEVFYLPMATHNTGSVVHTIATAHWASTVRDFLACGNRRGPSATGWTT